MLRYHNKHLVLQSSSTTTILKLYLGYLGSQSLLLLIPSCFDSSLTLPDFSPSFVQTARYGDHTNHHVQTHLHTSNHSHVIRGRCDIAVRSLHSSQARRVVGDHAPQKARFVGISISAIFKTPVRFFLSLFIRRKTSGLQDTPIMTWPIPIVNRENKPRLPCLQRSKSFRPA